MPPRRKEPLALLARWARTPSEELFSKLPNPHAALAAGLHGARAVAAVRAVSNPAPCCPYCTVYPPFAHGFREYRDAAMVEATRAARCARMAVGLKRL